MSHPDHRPATPWHPGEIAIQHRLGVAERMAELGPRVIRDHMPEQHRDFFAHLPFVVLGTVDPAGDVWATLRAGAPGFLDAPDPTHLRVRAAPQPDDPAEAGLGDGAAIGLLGIDLATRRRNRLNGTVRRDPGDGFAVTVQQSFGNCPQYIQVRQLRAGRGRTGVADAAGAAPEVSDRLNESDRALIARAATFFVATSAEDGAGDRQVDVSHRGGPEGFVRVGPDCVLTVPDYSGNRFFNTLGNILANPRAGLVFIDFANGDLLQLTGRSAIIFEGPEVDALPGAERLWRFSPTTVVRRAGAWPLRDATPTTARSR